MTAQPSAVRLVRKQTLLMLEKASSKASFDKASRTASGGCHQQVVVVRRVSHRDCVAEVKEAANQFES